MNVVKYEAALFVGVKTTLSTVLLVCHTLSSIASSNTTLNVAYVSGLTAEYLKSIIPADILAEPQFAAGVPVIVATIVFAFLTDITS